MSISLTNSTNNRPYDLQKASQQCLDQTTVISWDCQPSPARATCSAVHVGMPHRHHSPWGSLPQARERWEMRPRPARCARPECNLCHNPVAERILVACAVQGPCEAGPHQASRGLAEDRDQGRICSRSRCASVTCCSIRALRGLCWLALNMLADAPLPQDSLCRAICASVLQCRC